MYMKKSIVPKNTSHGAFERWASEDRNQLVPWLLQIAAHEDNNSKLLPTYLSVT
jgi:hypothetical protein